MATMQDLNSLPNPRHQRSKSSVLRSFIGHKRSESDGTGLPTAESASPSPFYIGPPSQSTVHPAAPSDMGFPGLSRQQTRTLGELQQNQQGQPLRSPKKHRLERPGSVPENVPRSPEKRTFATISLKSLAMRDPTKLAKSKENSPAKPKKAKSATNLAGLLSRNKSSKNLDKLATEEEARAAKDKENRTPPSSMTGELAAPPPIYAQFCSQSSSGEQSGPSTPSYNGYGSGLAYNAGWPNNDTPSGPSPGDGIVLKQRPKSFQPPYLMRKQISSSLAHESDSAGHSTSKDVQSGKAKPLTWGKSGKSTSRPNLLNAFSGMGSRSKSATAELSEPVIDPKEIDQHLESMLDRRNIPENQRYKMRNLADTIKMEFIRQDWAETKAKLAHTNIVESDSSMEAQVAGSDGEESKDKEHRKKTTRGRSLTLSKSSRKSPGSPTKKHKGEGTLGRHFRSKSTESVTSDRPSSSGSVTGATSILAKVKGQQGPLEFVSYLRKVQKPELVEVGKLHKLRLLLRNETVAWTEEFIRQGGMKETVGLLHRIMEVEWREEHEDALLHENLLCLKALCTTALALQYLHSIQATLFPAILHMLFDPEKKGPSEFTTRNIITSVLLTYIESATPQERVSRAQTVLGYLRDPEGKEDERPVSFVLEMRRDRPYRVWCKEAVNVTKEVFWIFLHHLNVVTLPADKVVKTGQTGAGAEGGGNDNGTSSSASSDVVRPPSSSSPTIREEGEQGHLAYMSRHFPQERPPVPAAPYVGGVEWDATNYLASHLDLLNALVACVPSRAARNTLRGQLRVSGWERCLGGSLRLCKEKFYGAVHDGLRTWVAAAAEDGWEVKDVRFGPPPGEARPGSPRKAGAGGAKKKKEDVTPRIEMPRLDFGRGLEEEVKARAPGKGDDGWLS